MNSLRSFIYSLSSTRTEKIIILFIIYFFFLKYCFKITINNVFFLNLSFGTAILTVPRYLFFRSFWHWDPLLPLLQSPKGSPALERRKALVLALRKCRLHAQGVQTSNQFVSNFSQTVLFVLCRYF